MTQSQAPQSSPRKQDARPRETGVVVSDKRHATRTVLVTFQTQHGKYGKIIRQRRKFQVHDPKDETKSGDLVEIAECRPISKTKHWRLVRVIEAAPQV
jgi:small subunit ribosomal protein S17